MKNLAQAFKKSFGHGRWQGFVYALIPLLGFAMFSLVPAILSLITSFSDIVGYDYETMKLIGFGNYAKALTSHDFWHSLGVSFYATLSQIISLITAIVIAVCVNRDVKGSKFFATLYFIPYICSSVAVAFMWQKIFNPEYGIINSMFGLDINWFKNAPTFMPMLILIMSWQQAGYGIVILGAALVSVDRTLYEAAKVDGASGIRQFFSITLPIISPTIYFLLTLGIVGGLQTFDIALIFVGGAWSGYGPDNMGQTLMLYIYDKSTLEIPYASAMSWLLFLILFGVQRLNEFISKRWVHAE